MHDIWIPSAVAFGLALVLLWKTIGRGALPGCGGGSGCDAVTSSRWSRWWRLPVAALGAALYLAMVACALAARTSGPPAAASTSLLWTALLALAVLAIGASLWFVAVQALVIRAVCPYCLASTLAGLLAGLAVILHTPRSAVAWLVAAGAAAIAMVLLIGGQLLFPPTLYRIESAKSSSDPEQAAPAADPNPPSAPALLARSVSLFGGRLTLDTSRWPLVGSSNAHHVIADLMDYTCPDCRNVHLLLKEAVHRYDGRLAVVLIPIPLEPACNPAVRVRDPHHIGACIYARFALAVWLSAPARFLEYHDWLLDGPKAPSPSAARGKAEELAGMDKLAAALSTLVEPRLRECVDIYQTSGAQQLPRLVLPQAILWGRLPSVQELVRILEEQLGISASGR